MPHRTLYYNLCSCLHTGFIETGASRSSGRFISHDIPRLSCKNRSPLPLFEAANVAAVMFPRRAKVCAAVCPPWPDATRRNRHCAAMCHKTAIGMPYVIGPTSTRHVSFTDSPPFCRQPTQPAITAKLIIASSSCYILHAPNAAKKKS